MAQLRSILYRYGVMFVAAVLSYFFDDDADANRAFAERGFAFFSPGGGRASVSTPFRAYIIY